MDHVALSPPLVQKSGQYIVLFDTATFEKDAILYSTSAVLSAQRWRGKATFVLFCPKIHLFTQTYPYLDLLRSLVAPLAVVKIIASNK